MERPDTTRERDEWDWQDALDSVWRRRFRILVATLASGALTAAVVVLLPRTYGAVTTIRVGRVVDKLLAEPANVAAAINSQSIGGRLRRAGFPDRRPEELADAVAAAVGTLPPGGAENAPTPFVTIVARGPSVDEARRLSAAVATLVVEEHLARYETIVARHRAYRDDLQRQITAILSEIGEIETALKAFRTNPPVSALGVLLMRAQLQEKQTQLLAFLREQRDVDIGLSANSEKTATVGDTVAPRSLIRPPRTVITLAGTTVGGLLAVFWALVPRRYSRKKGAPQLLASNR